MADNDQQAEFQKALNEVREQQKQLLEQQRTMLAQVAESNRRSYKDHWDRLGAIAPIFSGIIIAIGGTFFTLNYNQQQLKLQEAQTIERFIPHLLGDEKSKRAAILAISSLTDAQLAAKVASIFASPGTVSALESIAKNDTTTDRKALKNTLAKTLDNMAGNFIEEKRYDDAIATAKKALALQEQSFGPSSPELVANLDRIAELSTIYKDYIDAESNLKRSADIQKSSFGGDSLQFASQLRRLSALYKEQGLDSKSQSIMNQAIAIEQKSPSSTKSGGVGIASELHADSSSNAATAAELSSTAASTEKPARSSDSTNDQHNSTPSSTNAPVKQGDVGNISANSSGGKLSGQDRNAASEIHQEIQNKSVDPDSESTRLHEPSSAQATRLHESSPSQPARVEPPSEKQH